MKKLLILNVMLLAILVANAVAGVPQLMNYQGRLTDDAGNPLDTTVSIVFTIYDDSTGGTVKWSREHPSVSVVDGLFNVSLGVYGYIFADSTRYLGIQVGADPEIVPRTRLITVPYSHHSSNADTAEYSKSGFADSADFSRTVRTIDGATGGIILGDVSILSDERAPGNLTVAGKATIGPGHTNNGANAFVTGENNTASGNWSAVGGGFFNGAQGSYSVIPGGMANTISVSATASMAFGDGVYINDALRVIFFDGITSGRFGLNRDYFDGGINHPIHVGTDGSNGNGAHLTAGGVWTNSSSRHFKENFQKLDPGDLLHKISIMPVEAWNYKGSAERHIGPVAEDFAAAFDVGTINEDGMRDNQYLSNSDVAGVALAGVKELITKNRELEAEVAELKELVRQLLEQNQ